MTLGAFHQSVCTLALQDILRAGRDFSFVRGTSVCHISGRVLIGVTLAIRKSAVACKYHRFDVVFFLAGDDGATCCS